ncbi:MAG: hypothetical protein GWN62_17690, partial [Aliifodinibius sp.]|nr:hypothetical protein [Fodinibius sp.]
QILLQHLEDAYKNLDICEAYYRSIQEQVGLITCYRIRSIGYYRQSKFDEAIELTEKGLALAKAFPSPVEEALCLGRLGSFYFKRQTVLGSYQQVEEKLLDVITLFRKLELSFWESLSRNELGDVYISQGKFKEARNVIAISIKALRDF